MMQAGSLMVWEDLRYSTIEPSLRKGINQMAGISEEVKKVEMRWGDERSWCFSYRLATSNMLNIITEAFRAKEIGFVKSNDGRWSC